MEMNRRFSQLIEGKQVIEPKNILFGWGGAVWPKGTRKTNACKKGTSNWGPARLKGNMPKRGLKSLPKENACHKGYRLRGKNKIYPQDVCGRRKGITKNTSRGVEGGRGCSGEIRGEK